MPNLPAEEMNALYPFLEETSRTLGSRLIASDPFLPGGTAIGSYRD